MYWVVRTRVRAFFSSSFVLLFFTISANAQVLDSVKTIEKEIENAVEAFDPSTTTNAAEFAEYLQLLAQQPININSAGIDDLMKVPGISFKQAQEIVSYRNTKPFETIEELVNVRGLGKATMLRLQPYVTVGTPLELQGMLLVNPKYWLQKSKVEHISRFQRTLETQEGYLEDGAYNGDPNRIFQRTSFTSAHSSLNLTLEKDAGESWNNRFGYDYVSYHLAVKDIGIINQLVIGDYSLAFGQGLVIWNGGAFGKGADVINSVSRSERGMRPYRSTLESGFQRGVALSIGKTLETTLFYSNKRESASVIGQDSIRFPSVSGLHRTESELERRYNSDFQLMGGRIRWNTPYGWIGITGTQFVSDKTIINSTSLNNQFDFSGKELTIMGIDYTFFWKDISLKAELGRSDNGAISWVQTGQWLISDVTEFSFGIRDYSQRYQSPFGNGFAESGSNAQNEFGIYLGISQRFSDSFLLRGYIDQYEFYGPRFGTTQPTQGVDMLLYADYNLTSNTNLQMIGRYETKEDDRDEVVNGRIVSVLDPQTRWSIRSDINHQLSKRIRLRFRLEHARYNDYDENDEGWVLFQDIRWAPNPTIRIDTRITFFDTDSFNARIYQYENDVLYAFSNPVLNGLGQRSYILVKYSGIAHLDIWAKYGIFVFENQQSVGSGNDIIQGNTRSSFSLQVRYKF